jgi:osmotically inducible lipoprotein OsmB
MVSAKNFTRPALILVGMMALTACSGMSDTQQRTVSGGAIGATVGTVGTVMTGGCLPCGAAIGGAVGAGAGYVSSKMK